MSHAPLSYYLFYHWYYHISHTYDVFPLSCDSSCPVFVISHIHISIVTWWECSIYYNKVQYSIVLYCMVLYGTLLYYIVSCCTVLFVTLVNGNQQMWPWYRSINKWTNCSTEKCDLTNVTNVEINKSEINTNSEHKLVICTQIEWFNKCDQCGN